MELPRELLRTEWAQKKRRERRRMGIAITATVAVFLFCMCWRYNAVYYDEKFVPLQYLKSLWLALRLLFADLFSLPLAAQADTLIEALDNVIYYGAIARLKTTLMALVAGAALAVAGAIFQTTYRNPMASPNMLGATAGVKLGNVLVVMLYSGAAADYIYLRYEYCYGFTALCVGVVLLLGRLSGGRREYSVVEMVMAGSIVSQTLNVVTMYLMYNLEDEDLLVYQQLSMGTYLNMDTISLLLFFGMMAISLVPVFLTRYRLNALGLDPSEAAAAGVSTGPLRMMAQLCGVLMVTCAMIHCGEAGMLCTVVPCLVRQVVGGDFKKVCVYSALAGGIIMMLCRLLTSFLLIAGEAIPISFFINLALMPAFLVILARQKGAMT